MSSSLMPSEKNSWLGSPDRLSNGSTAMAGPLDWVLHRTGNALITTSGDADPSRHAEGLKPSRYIDAVAEDVLIVNDNVALVHAHPEFDPLVHRNVGIALGHRTLDSHRAADSFH